MIRFALLAALVAGTAAAQDHIQTLEGDTVTTKAHAVPGGDGAAVIVIETREGRAVVLSTDGWAELEIAGRRFQLDGEFLRQWNGSRFVLLVSSVGIEGVIQRLEMSGEDPWGDTVDGGNGPVWGGGGGPPAYGVQPTVDPSPPRPDWRDIDWRLRVRPRDWDDFYGGEGVPPNGVDMKRLQVDPPPTGGGETPDCGDPPPTPRGADDDTVDDDGGPFCVVLGPPPGG